MQLQLLPRSLSSTSSYNAIYHFPSLTLFALNYSHTIIFYLNLKKQNTPTMSDQPKTAGSYSYGTNYDPNININNPSSRQTVKFITAATIGVTLLLLSGLILTGTVIGLIIATPLLVIFSPVLVPAAITLFLVISGFLFSGGCGVAAIAALSWLYNYMSGNHPTGSDTLDYAKGLIADKARDVKDRAKDYGSYAQGRVQEATQGSY
ncbi:hypothetical protein VNO77_10930 [Canavalia gladiata]|uniref:Oleosin n=1 Tax=Canavalia gladiata TaxID=3824 RepID=A0AAN9MAX9_CANGL